MADNFETDAGTGGKIFASDDIASVDWPYAKLAFGPRNTAHEVEDAASKRIPVKVGDGYPAGAVVAGQVSLSGAEAALTSIAARRFRVRALSTIPTPSISGRRASPSAPAIRWNRATFSKCKSII